MTGCMSCSPGCWAICILCAIGWWLIASALLLLSWNLVVAAIANVKKVKYWHVLLMVLTLATLFGPLCLGRRACRGMRCSNNSSMECRQGGMQYGGSCSSWKIPPDSSAHPAR